MTDTEIKSPCKGICEYDDKKENTERICRGCFRTAEEITEWFTATQDRKKQIRKSAKERKYKVSQTWT